MLSNCPNWKDFSIISFFWGHFWSKFGYLAHLGAHLYGPLQLLWPFIWSPSTVDYEDITSRFNLNVFCGYYVLSNGPNWEDFSIISIFAVIFGQNLGIWPPGVPIYRAATNFYAIDIEDIASRFNLNVFLCLLCVI